MITTLSARSSWSLSAMCLLPLVVAQVGAMMIAATVGGNAAWPIIGVVAAVAIATIVLTVRVRMPAGAKAAQIGSIIVALLLLVATQDIFGLRVAGQRIADAGAAVDTAAPPPETSAMPEPGVALRASGSEEGAVVAALSASLQGMLPPSAPQVEAAVTIDDVAGLRNTTMTWSLVRGEARRWCGRLRVSGMQEQLVVDHFRAAILAAVAASPPGALACY